MKFFEIFGMGCAYLWLFVIILMISKAIVQKGANDKKKAESEPIRYWDRRI